jgi:hypothetical protein
VLWETRLSCPHLQISQELEREKDLILWILKRLPARVRMTCSPTREIPSNKSKQNTKNVVPARAQSFRTYRRPIGWFPPLFVQIRNTNLLPSVVVRREGAYEYLSIVVVCRLSMARYGWVVVDVGVQTLSSACTCALTLSHFRLDSKCKHTKHTRTLTKPVSIKTLIHLSQALSSFLGKKDITVKIVRLPT